MKMSRSADERRMPQSRSRPARRREGGAWLGFAFALWATKVGAAPHRPSSHCGRNARPCFGGKSPTVQRETSCRRSRLPGLIIPSLRRGPPRPRRCSRRQRAAVSSPPPHPTPPTSSTRSAPRPRPPHARAHVSITPCITPPITPGAVTGASLRRSRRASDRALRCPNPPRRGHCASRGGRRGMSLPMVKNDMGSIDCK